MEHSTDLTSLRASVTRARSHLARAGAADLELADELDRIDAGLARLVGEETAVVTRVRLEQARLRDAKRQRTITLGVAAGVALAVACAVVLRPPPAVVVAPSAPVVTATPVVTAESVAPPPVVPAAIATDDEPSPPPVRHQRPGFLSRTTSPAATGFGGLTVVCMPKCDSIIDNDVPLGPGHVFNRPVRSGRHVLVLSAPNGVKKTLSVEVTPEQTREIRISMDAPQPKFPDPTY